MLNRSVVCFFASLATMISLAFVAMGVHWLLSGQMSEGDAVFLMGGWLLAALLFGTRAADPEYLDPISIVKGR